MGLGRRLGERGRGVKEERVKAIHWLTEKERDINKGVVEIK